MRHMKSLGWWLWSGVLGVVLAWAFSVNAVGVCADSECLVALSHEAYPATAESDPHGLQTDVLSATEQYATSFMQALAGEGVELNDNLQAIFVRILARQLDEDATGHVTESGAFAQLVQVFTFVASSPDQRPNSPLDYRSAVIEQAREAAQHIDNGDATTGNLQVTLEPAEAVDAGAQWRRANTNPWFDSGTTETDIPVGGQTVEFKAISGWSAPGNAAASITAGQTTPLTRGYERETGVRIASWNIERLGHGGHKSFPALAKIASRFDLIAVQEVMTEEGIQRLHAYLEDHTDETWGIRYSDALGRSTYREKYAFLWRESRINFLGRELTYLDITDAFAREPYSARFESAHTGRSFVIGTVHITYGQTVGDRVVEVHALREYWDFLNENIVEPGDTLILTGDFNLRPSHDAWDELKEVALPMITEGATTLSSIDGRYANLYDNIWLPLDHSLPVTDSGIFRFPLLLGWDHEKSRRHVSDHAPVYIIVGNAQLNVDPIVVTIQDSGDIRGNRNSGVYHRPDCPSYDLVAEHNREHFETPADAERAGYRLAGNCP